MASGSEHDIKQLNTLIEATLDSAQGYMDAADEAKNSRFSAMFRDRATDRREIAERLHTRVKSLGGQHDETKTLGKATRRFANLKQKMGGTDASIIAEVEAVEDHVKDLYQKIMMDEELSDPVRTAIASELAQIEANHDEMSALKHHAA